MAPWTTSSSSPCARRACSSGRSPRRRAVRRRLPQRPGRGEVPGLGGAVHGRRRRAADRRSGRTDGDRSGAVGTRSRSSTMVSSSATSRSGSTRRASSPCSGYSLRTDRQGSGFASEAAGALIDRLFASFGVHRVVGDARSGEHRVGAPARAARLPLRRPWRAERARAGRVVRTTTGTRSLRSDRDGLARPPADATGRRAPRRDHTGERRCGLPPRDPSDAGALRGHDARRRSPMR